MFDFSFAELMLTAAVALVVIGPEKLPKVARTVGALLGRVQRYVYTVKQDLQRDIQLDELRQTSTLEDLQRLQHDVQQDLQNTLANTASMPSTSNTTDKTAPPPPQP